MSNDSPSRFTRAQEDCLKELFNLGGDGRAVPTGELAGRLRISPASVTEMVTRLAAHGLVEHDRYHGQALTAAGRRAALELVRHHRLIEMFLVQVLGYTSDEVHEEAERLEHVISERMEERIFELLGRPDLDPHGHPIPTRDGVLTKVSARSLSDCGSGESVVVRAVSDDDSDRLRELVRRGLVPGAQLEIVAGTAYEGPVETRLVTPRGRRRLSVPLGLARAVSVEGA